ncbi:MAG: membrane dipeptidase [Candidatus Xenobia bacterium]
MDAPVTPDSLARANKVLQSNPSLDLHTHLGLWETRGLPDISELLRYIGDDRMRQNVLDFVEGGVKSASICLTPDIPIIALGQPGNIVRPFEEDQAWEEYQRQQFLLHENLQTLPMKKVTRIDEIESVAAEGKLAVFLSTEGGHMVEKDLGRMEQLYQDGIRNFQPVHYAANGLGDNQTDPPRFGGLSPLGKEAVREACRLKMTVDAAHASFESARSMAEIVGGPIVLSHTMLRYDSPRFGSYQDNRPRWVTADHARLVAETGGVIGVWPYGPPYGVASMEAFVEAVKVLADTVGIDHIGWATDWVNPLMGSWFSSCREFPHLCAALLETGFSEQDLAQFIGGNALRVRRHVLRA